MYFVLLFQQLIAASTHLVAKSATTELHPAVVVFYRGMFSFIGFSIWWFIRRKHCTPIEKVDYKKILLLGLINIPINQILFIWGIKFTTAPNSALAYALTPAYVLIISRVFYGESITRNKLLGISIAFIGTFVILLERGVSLQSSYVVGNLMVLAAGFAWAFYTSLGRSMSIKYGGIYVTALSMIVGFILYVPVFVVIQYLLPLQYSPEHITSQQWLSLLYLGIITSGLGFGLWYYSLTKIEASKVSVFNNVQPVLTTILAFFIFHQEPSLIFVLGGVVALGGVLLTQRG